VARAKQTDRAEARRRHRQAVSQATTTDEADDLDFGERKPDVGPAKGATAKPGQARAGAVPSGRLGFTGAFRAAYHPARIMDDLRALPSLLRSRALLAALGLVLAGAVAVYLFPRMTGSAFAWELLVLPGSALGPQLVAGFFAPRASYLLGFITGLFQGLVFTVFLTQFADRLGATLSPEEYGNLLTLSFVTGPISGTLFAAAAAWYRRFLRLSSPNRGQPSGGSRGGSRNQSRRATSR